MKGSLTAAERKQLQALQKQRRDDVGYVKVTVLLLLPDKNRPMACIAENLGLDQATVYRYAGSFASLGLGLDQSWPTSSRAIGAGSAVRNRPTCAAKSTPRAMPTCGRFGPGWRAPTG